jgi:hypothetical protein
MRLTSPVTEVVPRQRAEGHAVIGERAAVVDQAIKARAEAAGISDVERAGQREIAGDIDQVAADAGRAVRRAELVIQDGAACQRQVAGNSEDADTIARGEVSARSDRRVADSAVAAQGRAAGYRDVADCAVHNHRATIDTEVGSGRPGHRPGATGDLEGFEIPVLLGMGACIDVGEIEGAAAAAAKYERVRA